MPRPSGLCRITYRPTPPAPCIRRSGPPKPGGSSSILPRGFCHRFSTSHSRKLSKLSSTHSRGERILAESPTRTLPKSHNHCAGVLVGPINIRCNCLDDLIHCSGVVSQGGAPRCGLPRRVIQRSAANTVANATLWGVFLAEAISTGWLVTVTTRPPWSIAVTAIWDSPAERGWRRPPLLRACPLAVLLPNSSAFGI